jgi:AcrR family transcriptional regulator
MGIETVPAIGRRERSKLDKRRRIREATREVFRRKGYEAATTREIADLADVAIGTLFAYAADKRELLMLVINDDREALPDVQMNFDGGSTLDTLIEFFRPRYRYWAQEPELSRLAVQETINYDLRKKPRRELARFYEGRGALIATLAAFFSDEQQRGRISADASSENIATLFMALYQSEVREWLRADKPKVANGLNRLRKMFGLALNGVVS